ncbi:MAG: isoprenylcysteine carboxylmethyltransferase family protein [Bacteroidota bacterium]
MALQEEFEKRGNWLFRYRGTLPFIILIAGVLLYLRRKIYPETSFLDGTSFEIYYEYICFLISLSGLFIRVYTMGRTPKNTSGGNVKKQVAGKLNTTGSYSLMRHPLYVGNFFMWLGPILLTGHIWFIVVVCLSYWLYYERIMFAEEQFLRKKFGTSYLEWAEKVPPFFPHFKGFKKPDLPFSWKKVLKKEKNGIAAVFLVFSGLDIAGELIVKETNFNYFFAAGFILSAIAYLVIKLLKKRTRLLDDPGR